MKCKRKNFAIEQKEQRLDKRFLKHEYPERYKNKNMESINWFKAYYLLPWYEKVRVDEIQWNRIIGA